MRSVGAELWSVTEDWWKLYEPVVRSNLVSFRSLAPIFLGLISQRLGWFPQRKASDIVMFFLRPLWVCSTNVCAYVRVCVCGGVGLCGCVYMCVCAISHCLYSCLLYCLVPSSRNTLHSDRGGHRWQALSLPSWGENTYNCTQPHWRTHSYTKI